MQTSSRNAPPPISPLHFRSPKPRDGAAIWQFVQSTGQLEPNTPYCYLLLASDFSDTCLIAEQSGRLIGAVLGYHPPSEPQTAFVWQVGVLPDQRGKGVALQMLKSWLQLPANQDCKWLTATVADDNPASQALFKRLASDAGCSCEITARFTRDMFPQAHPPEPLYRVGPLPRLSTPLI